MKEENIVSVELKDEIEFDGHKIKIIKFDLEHINRGWNAQIHDYRPGRRSRFTTEDVVDFFEQFDHYLIDWEEGRNKKEVKIRGKIRTRYYAFVYEYDSGERKKMVIDIPEDFENEGIIITIY